MVAAKSLVDLFGWHATSGRNYRKKSSRSCFDRLSASKIQQPPHFDSASDVILQETGGRRCATNKVRFSTRMLRHRQAFRREKTWFEAMTARHHRGHQGSQGSGRGLGHAHRRTAKIQPWLLKESKSNWKGNSWKKYLQENIRNGRSHHDFRLEKPWFEATAARHRSKARIQPWHVKMSKSNWKQAKLRRICVEELVKK